MSQCELYRKCINYIPARHTVTNEPLSQGICFQMNCKRNPMRKYELDLYKTQTQLTLEEAERMKREEEITRRASIKIEQKLDLQKRPPISIEEQPTKIPREYASVADVTKAITSADKARQHQMTQIGRPLTEKDILPSKIEDDKLVRSKIQYPKMPVVTTNEEGDEVPPSVAIPQVQKSHTMPPSVIENRPYPSVKDVLKQIQTPEQILPTSPSVIDMEEAIIDEDEDEENREFMYQSIQRSRSIKALKSIMKQAEAEGYPAIVLAAREKISLINKEKMAKVRAAKAE